ncbi:MAG: outer membrane beta-barrel protein [Deltaproteobacteria bacterium]|nr:outer membrane beta-barrel protein [Deltaproteobacteria bacterium]
MAKTDRLATSRLLSSLLSSFVFLSWSSVAVAGPQKSSQIKELAEKLEQAQSDLKKGSEQNEALTKRLEQTESRLDELQKDFEEEREARQNSLRLSGNITTLTGWQRSDSQALDSGTGPRGIFGDGLANINYGTNGSTVGLFVDQLELAIDKRFSELLSLRADLDISPYRDYNRDNKNTDVQDVVQLEQATTGIHPADWLTLDVGRFNSGFGLEPIDRNELAGVSFSSVHRFLVPLNVTGVRMTVTTGAWLWDLYAVNDLADNGINVTSDAPSGGTNVRFSWGEEAKNWVKLSFAGGPESTKVRPLTFMGDLSLKIRPFERLELSAEGAYRQENGNNCGDGRPNCRYLGGDLQVRAIPWEQWNTYLRAGYLRDYNHGGRSGAAQYIIDGSLGVSYLFNDMAKVVLEYRIDYQDPKGSDPLTDPTFTHGIAVETAYSF